MREWFAASELSGLPGLPASDRYVRERAKRDAWMSRQRQASGGGREYHISALPAETKAALLLREQRAAATPSGDPAKPTTKTTPTPSPSPESSALVWEGWESRPESVKEEAERRLRALSALEALLGDGVGRMDAYRLIAEEVDVSVSTVRNWWRRVQHVHRGDWLPMLAPQYTGRTARAEYDVRIYQWFRDLYLHASRPSFALCYRRVQAIAEDHGLEVPHKATLIRRFEREEDPAVVVLEREGRERMLDLFPYVRRDRSHFRAMEALNGDGHVFDVSCIWPDGEVGRPVLISLQDLGTGFLPGWRVAKSENASDLALTILSVCDDWGVPEKLWFDNTLAMAAKRLTAGSPGRKRFRDRPGDPEGVLTQLQIDVHWTEVAHGQSKPIERVFKDLAERISKHPALEGAYLGPNTQEKPHNYGERAVPIADFVEIVEREIIRHNRQTGRDTQACGGTLSFWDAFERSYTAHEDEHRWLTEPQRRLLYLISEQVTVRRDSTIRLFGNDYWAEALTRYISRKVIARYHPDNLHGTLYVYTLSGQLLAEATCIDAKGFDDAEAAQEHRRVRGQWARSKRRTAELERRLESREVAALEPDPEPIQRPAAAGGGVLRGTFSAPATPERIPTIPKDASARGSRAQEEREEAERELADALDVLRPHFDRELGREAG